MPPRAAPTAGSSSASTSAQIDPRRLVGVDPGEVRLRHPQRPAQRREQGVRLECARMREAVGGDAELLGQALVAGRVDARGEQRERGRCERDERDE